LHELPSKLRSHAGERLRRNFYASWKKRFNAQRSSLLVRFAALPGDILDSLCSDFITEDLGQVLATVCGGDLAGIQSLIESESTDEWFGVRL